MNCSQNLEVVNLSHDCPPKGCLCSPNSTNNIYTFLNGLEHEQTINEQQEEGQLPCIKLLL